MICPAGLAGPAPLNKWQSPLLPVHLMHYHRLIFFRQQPLKILAACRLQPPFDEDGRQINPLLTRLTGNIGGVVKLFNRCGWQAVPESGTSLPHQYSLMAGQGVSGKD